MHHVPQPQDQARILKAALKEMDVKLPYQQALNLVARMTGHKDWQTHSAAFEAEQAAKAAKATALQTILGPKDGDLYEALVTVDQTLSARIRVRAHDEEQAHRLLRDAGAAQYPHGFEIDEGNYRGGGDFYLGDPGAIENLSEPDYYAANDNFWAKVRWQDEQFAYSIEMTRCEPDVSSDERRAKVDCVVSVSCDGHTVERESRHNVYGHLETHLEACVEEGDFEEDLDKLRKRMLQQLRRNHRT